MVHVPFFSGLGPHVETGKVLILEVGLSSLAGCKAIIASGTTHSFFPLPDDAPKYLSLPYITYSRAVCRVLGAYVYTLDNFDNLRVVCSLYPKYFNRKWHSQSHGENKIEEKS